MDHKELDAWKMSMDLVEDVYNITGSFPDAEKFGLISQMWRSAVSVPSNIAEGAARNSDKELIRFLYISLGSLAELETQLILSLRLSFIKEDALSEMIESSRKLILGLIRYLNKKK